MAVAAYERALELAPDDIHSILNNQGIVLQSRGDLEAVLSQREAALESYGSAVAAYDRALELAPDDSLH